MLHTQYESGDVSLWVRFYERAEPSDTLGHSPPDTVIFSPTFSSLIAPHLRRLLPS
jgi:hypothetical protein